MTLGFRNIMADPQERLCCHPVGGSRANVKKLWYKQLKQYVLLMRLQLHALINQKNNKNNIAITNVSGSLFWFRNIQALNIYHTIKVISCYSNKAVAKSERESERYGKERERCEVQLKNASDEVTNITMINIELKSMFSIICVCVVVCAV